jgi:hypothetical protein
VTVPLRVDFAGGWLDVPKLSRPGSFVVNCSIEPFEAHPGGGVGGSARAAVMAGEDPFESESRIAGWQDAAVITETGLCVWESGETPVLREKHNPDFLRGRMALLWTGKPHDTASIVDTPRDYALIAQAAFEAKPGLGADLSVYLKTGISLSYKAQIKEGMDALPFPGLTRKYCGSGWGGYALYLFDSPMDRALWLLNAGKDWEVRPIEPYLRGYGRKTNG